MFSDSRIEELKTRLTSQGQRVTQQRLAIYRYLIENDTHPTADDIYQALKVEYPSMSPATVYKTLELLLDLGLVTELGFADSPNRYDGNPEEHVNLICTSCGRITDLEVSLLEHLKEVVSRKTQFELHTQRHEYYGRCPDCR